jgi:MarR family transcriptional repressor of emrRAB
MALADRINDRAEAEAGHGGGAPAALVALTTFLDGCSIEQLRQVVGLSHSATVRLVDKLERRSLVTRRQAGDRRAVEIQLTPTGRGIGAAIVATRTETIEGLLGELNSGDRAELTELVERLLASIVERGGDPPRICRLCDVEGCGHSRGRCPVTRAALTIG